MVLQEIWKCANIPPRIQVFGWRLMRGAIATGMRAAARSKHIDQKCIRCGKDEDDFHLFFECKFVQAVWFASSLGLRVEGLQQLDTEHIQEIIYYILTYYNNKDAFPTILSILWSIWKARNDLLFNKTICSPLQVLYKAKAIQAEKEIIPNVNAQRLPINENTEKEPNHSEPEWSNTGTDSNIFTDAAWKCNKTSLNVDITQKDMAGIRIYFEGDGEDHQAIYIQAAAYANSALQAEAQAMEAAAQIARSLQIQVANFLTDNLTLAQSLQKRDPINHPGHWIIRPNLLQFLKNSQGIQTRIFKIKRDNNMIAHRLAQEATKTHSVGACVFSCTKHSLDQCFVIAALSNSNVQHCTLLSVSCQ